MRFFAGLALVLVGFAFAQSQLVVPQINNIHAVISSLPQFQGFLGQLDQILPQLTNVLSSVDIQSLKDKLTQAVLSQVGSNLNLDAIKDKLRPILQQFLGTKPQARFDFDHVLQQIAGAATSALPSIILGMIGKRDAVDARVNLNDVLALANKYQLLSYIPQLQQFLNSDKLQQIQNQFFATLVAAAGNNWSPAALAQSIQQLVSQFVPQLGQSRIDWEAVGQSALNGIVTALPGIAIGLVSLLGKREATDARAGLDDILALVDKFQLQTLIPQIEGFLTTAQLQQLQNQFFSTVVAGLGNNWNVATLAQLLQQLVSTYVPQIAQARINWNSIAQSALNGLAAAAPSIAIGLVSLVGKREATDARAGLNDILALVDKFQLQTLIPQIEGFLTAAQLQQLQNQFFSTVVAGLGNNWNIATLAQLLEQLVSTYVPQIAQLRIDWEAVGQSALNGLATALPGIAIGLVSLFGKREATDARAGLNDILALVDKFQLQTLIPQIEGFLTAAQLQQLQNQFLTTVVAALGNNWNIPTLAQILQQLVSQYVPQIAQARIDWEDLAQTALNGLASALPTIAISLVSLFGKRDASDARAGLDDILALVDKFQLQSLIPQIEGFLTPAQLQQLQNQFFTTVVAALGNNWNIATLAQLLQQLVSTYVPQIAQSRIDWEAVGQSALNGIVTALPGIAIGLVSLLGKREATDARAGLDDILALVDKFQLQSLIPQIEGFLTPAQLQQLQNQFFSTVVSGLGNNWNIATVAQLLQQLVSTYVPQIGQSRIDWEDLAQTALNGLASALPTIAISLVSLFGKRDLQINYQQLLAQLPVDKLAQIVNVVLNTDKSKVLASLRKLLQSFFPAYFGRINFDELAANVLNHMNSILPTLGQSIFSSILG